ncbi:MAG: hypothetical protein JF886_01575 [Candidatus Dormibacteraeota bacterium]|uniref:AtuA-like ferredoxin-fold domain-containing protein n=1 Tax=Candidatus Aeolococcus gillhamiae TaxID=3127015 RepID=A0A2W6AIL2_9BACT|nr:hypothetical protein [Candidatus Dormibacteraeota bacterium]PZR83434.1 MAG: hypothetical protein DLM65_01825 [Candidatus Dormibacter sp. RRmetagenome_bin12]
MSCEVTLADIARARSGDKGDLANVALFAADDAVYAALVREVTAERVRAHFGRFVRGEVERFEVPNVRALNFVLHEALDGGAARSLRSDPLGKSYGSLLLRMRVTLTDDEAATAPARQAPPR